MRPEWARKVTVDSAIQMGYGDVKNAGKAFCVCFLIIGFKFKKAPHKARLFVFQGAA